MKYDSGSGGFFRTGWSNKLSEGANGMARAHAASACVQSDSIKGLAQSIAKPAYHRLLLAEPALRRAVPTLIIAFLITICLGAFVQVIDQTRQKRAADQARPRRDGRLAGRTSRSHRLGPAGSRRIVRTPPTAAARPHSVLGDRRRPARHRHRHRPARSSPAFRSNPRSAIPPPFSTSSARSCRSPAGGNWPPSPTSPCRTATARWRFAASSNRCPVRSS